VSPQKERGRIGIDSKNTDPPQPIKKKEWGPLKLDPQKGAGRSRISPPLTMKKYKVIG